MNRTELAKNKYLELFGENSLEATQDTEFMEIYKTFVFGVIAASTTSNFVISTNVVLMPILGTKFFKKA